MSIVASAAFASGDWSGTYQVWLDPAKEPETSAIRLESRPTAGKLFHIIQYTWSQGGKPREGLFLISKSKVTWVDSFHQADPMVCTVLDADGTLELMGEYSGGNQTWKWRTRFVVSGAELSMVVHNIDPAGQEWLAVQADMAPVNR